MRNPIKLLLLPVMAVVLASCSLFPAGGPLGSPVTTSTPDLMQTLTAMAPSTSEPVSAPVATEIPPTVAPPTAEPSNATQPPVGTLAPALAPTSTNTPAGGIPVVQITPISANPNQAPVVIGPTAIPGGNRTRLAFQPYATSTEVQGTITGGTTQEYILRAAGGQLMIVNLASPSQQLYLRIYSAMTGQVLADTSAHLTSWQGILPSSQDYVIALISQGTDTNFSMNVTIPENIHFNPGAISATYNYPLRPRETHTFLLRASAGQTMSLTVSPTDKSVLLAFYGYQDGQPYLRDAVGETSWTGPVPATQDYVVQVSSVIDTDTTFRLDVVIQ
jgi:hypothetical protein